MTARAASACVRVSAAAAWCALVAAPALAQNIRVESIPPAATDPLITQWTTPHVAALDTSRPHLDVLFVYLHGLGGAPGGASDLIRTAASEGLYAVGITYPNDWVPFQLCATSECYENLRREILDGVDHSPHIAVSPTNSAINRLSKLIAYLSAAHPSENWEQFLDSGQPRWGSIVVWGHSQGGANAAVLARHVVLAGVITSAPATDYVGSQPAAWWSSHATPTDRYFGFCHSQDQLSAKLAAWAAIGIDDFGVVQDVATTPSPYFETHQLSSSVPPAQAGQYHNSVVANASTPRNPDGTPTYAPAWRYLILNAASSCSADFDHDGDAGTDADIEAFFACLGGNCCPACGSADFDGDGDTGTDSDIEAFFRVLGGGGEC
jgi:hypothetical protein